MTETNEADRYREALREILRIGLDGKGWSRERMIEVASNALLNKRQPAE